MRSDDERERTRDLVVTPQLSVERWLRVVWDGRCRLLWSGVTLRVIDASVAKCKSTETSLN
jgi:hypothetical protein